VNKWRIRTRNFLKISTIFWKNTRNTSVRFWTDVYSVAYSVGDVRHIEIHSDEPLVSDPSPYEVEIIAKLTNCKLFGTVTYGWRSRGWNCYRHRSLQKAILKQSFNKRVFRAWTVFCSIAIDPSCGLMRMRPWTVRRRIIDCLHNDCLPKKEHNSWGLSSC
jgi:hypothetical protein